jgi:hypothetical protein
MNRIPATVWDVASDAPRFWSAFWNSGTVFGRGGDGPFREWLDKAAPLGYRLVTVIEQPPWPGRPEMGTTRECIFERGDA